MSPLPVRMIPKKEVVLNSVAEFLGIWAARGEASLSLTTKDGVTTIAFHHSFSGHPEDPLHPPPSPAGSTTKRRRRRRGPARRERDRHRAARHQAAQAGAPPASLPISASPAAPSTPEHLRDSGRSAMDTVSISPPKEIEREELEVPSEPPTTSASPPPSSTSTWTEAEREEFGKLDQGEQLQQVWDFMKSVAEKRQADRSVDLRRREEFVSSLAQVVIKEKLGKTSDVLNT